MSNITTAAQAAAINNRMIRLAVDAENNASTVSFALSWLRLAEKWADSHDRPVLSRSCKKMAGRIAYVTCEVCGSRTSRAEALVIRNGVEVFLCPECQGGAASWNI